MELPSFILNQIINKDNLTPINVNKRYGSTGYIDYIINEDFINNSDIIWGIDNAQRYFLSINYNSYINGVFNENNIMTIFQRYTDQKRLWVTCGKVFCNEAVVFNFIENELNHTFNNIFGLFFEIINNGKITTEYIGWDNIPIVATYELTNFKFNKLKEIKQKLILLKYVLKIQRNFKERIQIPPNGWLVQKLLQESMIAQRLYIH